MWKERIAKVRPVGTSLGIILPAAMLQEYNIKRGDELVFTFADKNTICFRKITIIT